MTDPEVSFRNVSSGSGGIYEEKERESERVKEGEGSVNTGEYALQMCRPVTPQVNTLTDGQLRTGWPHRPPPRESAKEAGGWWGGRGERRSLC